MKAIVVSEPGPPEVLTLTEVPKPDVRDGWVLIRVMAFGLNRSEMFTRQGHSGSAVEFPRILGIECVGMVESAGAGSDFQPGSKVAAVMGGMGRAFDGSYAEYTLVPESQVIPIESTLDWATLAALPETFLTAWGSLVDALEVSEDDTLFIRGGSSSVGMAACTLAKSLGARVIATTRSESKRSALEANGADHVVIDSGSIAPEVRALVPEGVSHVLELVGTTTLLDSLQAAAPKGVVCNTGILGNAWTLEKFEPMADIPSTVRLTTFQSDAVDAAGATEALNKVVRAVEDGRLRVTLDRVFELDQLAEAHSYMESNQAKGKLVGRTFSSLHR